MQINEEIILDYSFQRESFADAVPDLMKLSVLHDAEVKFYPAMDLNIDWQRYITADERGYLRLYTTRVEGELIGYSIYFLASHGHYKDYMFAVQDSIFIHPDRRGFGRSFISFCNDSLTHDKVDVVLNAVKASHDFGPMLEGLGFEKMDVLYGLRLSKEGTA